MRRITVLIFVSLLCAVAFANSAQARTNCSDMSWLNKMGAANKLAIKGSTYAADGSYIAGRTYVRIAISTLNSAPQPCKSVYKQSHIQYTVALDYELQGINQAIAGNWTSATRSIKLGTQWMKKSMTSMQKGY